MLAALLKVVAVVAICASGALSSQVLTATLHGPMSPAVVDAHDTGATGDGVLLCDVSLSADAGGAWSVAMLVFEAAGSGSHDTAFTELALYQDNGNGLWDGPAIDVSAAAPAAGFVQSEVTFNLAATAFPASTERRFFLVGKLNGTAVSGQTFGASLEGMVATPPAGGTVTGLPTAASVAVQIDTARLEVRNSPHQPEPVWHTAGFSAAYRIASFRMRALNGGLVVNGMTLTTGGTGDWTSDVQSVRVYLDDGDGVFDSATDSVLHDSPGASLISVPLTLALSASEIADLWIEVEFEAGAGDGWVQDAARYDLHIAAATDVQSSAPVVLGVPAPVSVELGAIAFDVASFAPVSGNHAGGEPVTIKGSGFVLPFAVRIGGVVCSGTPIIAAGTTVSGLLVPAGTGTGLSIEIRSGLLPWRALNETFDYLGSPPPPPPLPPGTRIVVEAAGNTYGDGALVWLGDVRFEGKLVTFTIVNSDPSTTLHLIGAPAVQLTLVTNCDPSTVVHEQPGDTAIAPLGSAEFSVLVDPGILHPQFSFAMSIETSYSSIPFQLVVAGNAVEGGSGNGGGDDDDASCAGKPAAGLTMAATFLLLALAVWRRRGVTRA